MTDALGRRVPIEPRGRRLRLDELRVGSTVILVGMDRPAIGVDVQVMAIMPHVIEFTDPPMTLALWRDSADALVDDSLNVIHVHEWDESKVVA